MERFFFLLALLGSATCLKVGNVGVLHMHGFWEAFDNPHHQDFKKYVEEKTGVEVHLIDAFNDIAAANSSITPLWVQVPAVLEQVKEIAAQYDKIIAVGYSQGGVIWRGMIESWDNHNVDTFISLASPQHGTADFPPKYLDFVEKKFPDLDEQLHKLAESSKGWKLLDEMLHFVESFHPLKVAAELMAKLLAKLSLYIPPIQENFAPSNYLLLPAFNNLYLKTKFFPELNNEAGTEKAKSRQKDNFLRLRKLILIGGPDEDVVNPWQSEQFGFRTKDNEILSMKETKFYKKDLFGLKTLDERDGVKMCTVEGVNHQGFPNDTAVLNDCVFPAIEDALRLN